GPAHPPPTPDPPGARLMNAAPAPPPPPGRPGVNDKGFLEALGGFDEPVGPAFWERG
ncbi:ubiquinol-cytochrome C reductase, partial [Streptomyces sp. NPDC059082]